MAGNLLMSAGRRGKYSIIKPLIVKQVYAVATNSFIPACFLKKIIDLPGGQNNDPSLGKTLFSFSPPSNSLVSVSDT